MERMDGADATFIYTETDRAPGNIGACLVLDGTGDDLHESLLERLRHHTSIDPLYRRRLHRVPLDLHHPVWAEDPDFASDNHVARQDVGPDGLATCVAQLMGMPLPHDRPLWHVTLVEGLDGGRSALVIRTHHAAVDGVAGISLLTHLLDLDEESSRRHFADAAPAEAGESDGGSETAYGGSEPTTLELVVDAGRDLLRDPLRQARTAADLVRDLATSVAPGRRGPAEVLGASIAPATPFNVGLCGRRSVRMVSLDLGVATTMRAAAGVTINELVLALVAGMLRRYLANRDALPEQPLVCYLPMTTGAQDHGNNTTVIPVRLATDEPDARRRVELVAVESKAAKGRATGESKPLILDVSALTGPALGALMERTAVAMGLTQRLRLAGNVVVSNVARVPVPLWSSGARVVDFFPIGVLTDGAGLNVTYLSYEDRLQVSVMADAEAVPDIDVMVADLEDEWAGLQVALGVSGV